MCLKTIERYHRIICRSLFRTDSTLSYDGTLLGLEKVGMVIENSESDESVWLMGETEDATVADLIAGAYWFAVDYHGGQSTLEYKVCSVLSGIYNPGASKGPIPDSSESRVYDALVAKLKGANY